MKVFWKQSYLKYIIVVIILLLILYFLYYHKTLEGATSQTYGKTEKCGEFTTANKKLTHDLTNITLNTTNFSENISNKTENYSSNFYIKKNGSNMLHLDSSSNASLTVNNLTVNASSSINLKVNNEELRTRQHLFGFSAGGIDGAC